MSIVLLGAAALLPSLLLVTYFHRRDVYPEPPGVLWKTFGLGILTVFPVLAVALPLDFLIEAIDNPLLYGAATAFFGAAIPEELFKFLVLWGYSARHMEYDEPMDGLVYGATASLGFATLENVLYVSDGGFGVALLRAFTAVPGHAFLGAIMGYYLGRAMTRHGADRRVLLRRSLWIPIVLHGLYDTPLLATARIDDPFASITGWVVMLLLPMALLIVVGEAWWAVRLVRRLRAEQLAAGPPTEQTAPASLPTVESLPAARLSPQVAASPPRPPSPQPLPPRPLPPGSPRATLPATAPRAPGGRRPPGAVLAWLLTLGGGGLACAGGLVSLAVAIGLALEEQSSEDFLYGIVGGIVIGVLPLILGTALFLVGIWRLNGAYRSMG